LILPPLLMQAIAFFIIAMLTPCCFAIISC